MGNYRSAVCRGHEMRRGRHYATFTLCSGDDVFKACLLGVVGPGFEPTNDVPAFVSPQGWVLSTHSGKLRHAGGGSKWAGQSKWRELKERDEVVRLPPHPCPPLTSPRLTPRVAQGLLLDLDAATLTVWVN
eukprot:COSAG04_NODE_4022_length_2357_cov_2.669176_1_plen_130_part_10